MNTSLAHLPAIKQEQLKAVTKIITHAVQPEKIILFGMYSTAAGSPDFFTEQPFPVVAGSYDLLVITRPGERRYDHELQDIIENRCRNHVPVTILVHDIDYVNSRLEEGHYFFSLMREDCILLYEAGAVPLVAGIQPDLLLIREIAQRDYERWKHQAEAFFRSAVFNQERDERRLSVFLLHQAAEQIYQAILLAFTGYKPCTHNLDKLRRYTNRFSIELALLFPRNEEQEDRLFKLLLQGYVDARYKEDYDITTGELSQLTGRVNKLISIAERVCMNRFVSLGKMAAARQKDH